VLDKVCSGAELKAEQIFSFSKPLITMNQLCWCGNPDLQDFSPEYLRCNVCSTLMSKSFPSADVTAITNEESDFYGKKYWLDHQVEELGLASIVERSRSDLLDRCGWWLAQVLEFRLPPVRLLEIGCSHGAFLALTELAGFSVTGLELSPWVVDFARRSFGVDVRIGPIERQGFQPGSFDVICLFDVLEHLQDPVRTLECCTQVLTPNGILVVQTPRYPFQMDFGELQERRHPFLQMMLPDEHFFLFSEESVKRLISEAGLFAYEFVPACFAHYDMMFVAGKGSLAKNSPQTKREALEANRGGRLIQAFLSSLQEKTNLEAQGQELYANLVQAKQDITSLDAQRQELRANLVQARQDIVQARQDIEILQGQLSAARTDIQGLSEKHHHINNWLRQTYAERAELRRWAGARAVIKQSSKLLVSGLEKRLPVAAPKAKKGPIRICVDLRVLPAKGEHTGLALAVVNLLKRLSQNERFEFIYLTLEPSFIENNALLRPQDSLIHISHDSPKLSYGRSQVEVIQTLKTANLKRHRTDIFYSPFGELSAVARGFKTVCLIPDLPHRDFCGLVSIDQLDRCESNLSNTLSTITKMQLTSEYMRQRVIEAYPIRPADTFITYLLLDDRLPTRPLKQSTSRPFFICPEGYYSRKSIETLLSGYKEYLVSGRTSGWAMVFGVSNDDRRHEFRALVHSFELDDDVEFENDLQGETWISLFRAASALLYPALHEGSGIPILEAFRYSLPVICSSVGSLPEVAGDAAIYVNPQSAAEITQAMLQISLSAETRSGLVKAGSRQLEMFNQDEQVKKLREAFLHLCIAK
jgi:glycosyltransferase involved in cell wall biosynthesis/2-polyprenyl-3-methyl-5-hydroxy-6-metoxy-1,4-benzoquinol methylase